eukprot:scaffold25496_cov130-Isochrysis_galbana.AAC.10
MEARASCIFCSSARLASSPRRTSSSLSTASAAGAAAGWPPDKSICTLVCRPLSSEMAERICCSSSCLRISIATVSSSSSAGGGACVKGHRYDG